MFMWHLFFSFTSWLIDTLLPSYASGISTIVLSGKYKVFMAKSHLLDKAVCSRTVLTA